MDEYTADAFANREEAIPVLTVANTDDGALSDTDSKQDEVNKSQDINTARNEPGLSLQDRLFAKLLQQVIPANESDDGAEPGIDRRSSKYVKRPAFSLPLMTNNFRKFNARIGIVFVFQNNLLHLFTWRTPSHTLSLLSVYTFVCLDPYLLVILPAAIALLFIMVPAFLTRHPPPPTSSTSSTSPYYSYYGPALAPAPTVKPASETSKDFFRNMRDLQNSMSDFSTLHDTMVKLIAPATNFSDETFSSALFLALTVLTAVLFITAHLLPWRLIFLIAGGTAIISGHPDVQQFIDSLSKKSSASDPKRSTTTIPLNPSEATKRLNSFASITLTNKPETREVEIFELQYLSSSQEWVPHLYTPQPYDPLSPARIAGDRPKGTRFFEDVEPPKGWAWKGKKWILDFEPGEWVAERMVQGVGFEVSGVAAGEGSSGTLGAEIESGGWVWDLATIDQSLMSDSETDIYDFGDDSGLTPLRTKKKGKHSSKKSQTPYKDWEESTIVGLRGMGNWRRRRWVRMVKRVGMAGVQPEDTRNPPKSNGKR